MMLLLADFFHENNVGYLPFLGGTLIDVDATDFGSAF